MVLITKCITLDKAFNFSKFQIHVCIMGAVVVSKLLLLQGLSHQAVIRWCIPVKNKVKNTGRIICSAKVEKVDE